jgi:glucarate dehydratase
MVLAGIEMALLDLQGKVAGCSVAELLGGKLRTAIPTTAYVFRRSETADRQAVDSPSAITDLCAELIDRYGFQTIKLKAGAVPWPDDVAAARAVRDRFPDHCLRVDPNGMWNISAAFRAASMMRDLSLEWLEDPVDSVVGMAQLTNRVDIPTATNMCLTWPGELPAAVSQRAVDVVLLDIWFSGGIRAARNFGLACAAWQLGIGLHSAGGGTSELGVGTAAMLHLAASLPALEFAADSMYHDASDDVIAAPFRYGEGGTLTLPHGTGLGVELDPEKVEKWSCGDRIVV